MSKEQLLLPWMSGGNTYGPHFELNTPEVWSSWLKEQSDFSFSGNTEKAGRLLDGLIEGRNWLHRQFKAKGVEIEVPKIAFLLDDNQSKHNFFYGHEHNIIVEKLSNLELDTNLNFNSFYDYLYLSVKIPDLYKLVGVEEMHHAIFIKYKGVPEVNFNSLAEYDALEHEFSALKWKIRFAKEHNISRWTIISLEERLKLARKVRNNNR